MKILMWIRFIGSIIFILVTILGTIMAPLPIWYIYLVLLVMLLMTITIFKIELYESRTTK